ncbi:MAG: hypothetical protein QOJ19_1560, partial [Acidimicrobiia bacterium]|nr:hypothetical protein [Acidimicrobiia bacterium]
MRVTGKRFGALLCGLALVAVACGSGGGNGQTGSGNLIDKSVGSDVKGALGSGASTTSAPVKEPTSMDEWEALWKTQREAIVKKIKDNKWGLQPDGKTILGPDGFKVDLNKCPGG